MRASSKMSFIVMQISLQEVGGCGVELHIRCEAPDLLAAEGGEHCASLCLSLLFPLSLDQLIRTLLTHLYGTVVRRRARTAVLPRLQIVRLQFVDDAQEDIFDSSALRVFDVQGV